MNRKIVLAIVVLVLIAIGVALPMLLSNLNSLVAKVIEENGSEVTATRVAVSGVAIKIRDGRGSIDDLRVASPEGYKASDAFTLANITMDIDIRSATGDPVVIDEVRISEPVVSAEFTKTGASNIDEIRKRVQGYTGGASGGDNADSDTGEAKRIRIKSFVFEKGRIEVDASALGIEKRTVDLPEIHLDNVGGSNGGTPDEIAQEILGAIARKAAKEIANSEVNRLIKDQLGESLGDKAKGLLDKITD